MRSKFDNDFSIAISSGKIVSINRTGFVMFLDSTKQKTRWTLAFLVTLVFAVITSLPANAQQARIQFTVVKVGLIVGGQMGSGAVYLAGRAYPISVGGLGVGFTIGASVAKLSGTVTNFRRISDIAGKYSAVGGSGAYVVGVAAVTLKNSRGVVITVAGPQAGLEISLDLSGIVITLK